MHAKVIIQDKTIFTIFISSAGTKPFFFKFLIKKMRSNIISTSNTKGKKDITLKLKWHSYNIFPILHTSITMIALYSYLHSVIVESLDISFSFYCPQVMVRTGPVQKVAVCQSSFTAILLCTQ